MTATGVLVCGGRDYADRARVYVVLDQLLLEAGKLRLIHGDAPGADQLAADWALENRIRTKTYPADWGRYGRAAGPIRNATMLAKERPDLVVAFPGGRGTADMRRRAGTAGVPVLEIAP